MKTKTCFVISSVILLLNSCSKSGTTDTNPTPAPVITAPVMGSTVTVSSISGTSAISGGAITADGGAAITARGICWSTSSGPTIANSKTTDGTGTGSFVSNLSGLTENTQYFVRSYATNSKGTSYGTEISFTTFLPIGANFQGGKLAYILAPGDPGFDPAAVHGLVVTPSDLTGPANNWLGNGSYSVTGATATAIGTGNANTTTIVNAQGAGSYAAKLCADLVLNTYSDWYLPSKDELNKVYLNKTALGIITNMHWSSSEINNQEVWVQYFSNGQQINNNKANGGQTLAVRSF